MLGKWGIRSNHFLIPLLVGILIFGTLGFAQNAEAVIMKLKDYTFYVSVADKECPWIDFNDPYCGNVTADTDHKVEGNFPSTHVRIFFVLF